MFRRAAPPIQAVNAASPVDTEGTERVAAIRRTRSEWLEEWAEYHEAQRVERDYALKLDHYRDDFKDPRQHDRIRPKGRQLYGLLRRKQAQISQSEIFLDLRPGDPSAEDAVKTEAAKWAIEWVLRNPLNDYESLRDLMVQDALAARLGCLYIYFDETVGPEGEICIEQDNPGDVMWQLPYHTPHHPQCRRLMRTKRMRLSEVKSQRGWKNLDQVRTDSTRSARAAGTSAGSEPLGSQAYPEAQDSDDGYVEITFDWRKNVTATMRAEVDGSLNELEPGQRFMECVSCGQQSETEAEAGDGIEFPEMIERGCQVCSGNLRRTDGTVDEYVWEERNTLTIAALEQGVELYHGPWPFLMRTFPVIVYAANPQAHQPMGQSETSTNMSMQTASNMTLRLGLEHMALARPYWALPQGTVDHAGKPWQFGRHQGLAMHFNPNNPPNMMPAVLQPPGLPASWNTLWQALNSDFRQDMGTGELSFGEDQTKNIPATTALAIERTGDIPVDHQIEWLQRAEGPGFGVILDLIRATWTTERFIRMRGPDGAWTAQAVLGVAFPDYDVFVTADPSIARYDSKQIQNLKMVADSPPWQFEFLGKGLNIPLSQIRDLQQASPEWQEFQAFREARVQAEQVAQRMGGAMSGPPNPAQNGAANGMVMQ